MTQPTHDRQFARDVAKQLDRRRTRRKVTVWTGLVALIIAAAGYLRFGGGLGTLGLGGGSGVRGDDRHALVPPERCVVRVSAAGITVAGKPMTQDAAIAACKDTPGADVTVTGDAREGDWQGLQSALQAAGVRDIALHHPRSAGSASAPH
ncbi:MAG TPA: hypothetical protein VHW23_16465 [Kofleriaceae bacterium]|jgi:hypothetical protein|nr:hypothetical protein [Kofleriaceae bacterium]